MSHYEERLEQDLGKVRTQIAAMADKVEEGLKNAVRALQTGNRKLAAETILADHPINRRMREIDRLCHAFIAVHLPSAGHLRLLSSAIRANIAIERIGDYAVTIARVSQQLAAPPEGAMGRELERIANEAQLMLSQSIKAFKALNAESARATMVMEQEMEYDLDSVYAELTANEDREKVRELLSVFVVLTHLKRVADQAKNLCEETIFAVTGETKAPKVYNILFVDEDNSCLSQMAEAVARKTYPGSGNYSSAGRQPAAALNAAMLQFMEQHGFDMGNARPRLLDLTHQELVEKHIIVSLQGPIKNYIAEIPFHTTGLEWEVGTLPAAGADDAQTTERLEAIYREIAVQLRDLLETLRGTDAP
jgi:phosphate transport system protein